MMLIKQVKEDRLSVLQLSLSETGGLCQQSVREGRLHLTAVVLSFHLMLKLTSVFLRSTFGPRDACLTSCSNNHTHKRDLKCGYSWT